MNDIIAAIWKQAWPKTASEWWEQARKERELANEIAKDSASMDTISEKEHQP